VNILISSAGRRVSLVEAFRADVSDLRLGSRIYACDLKPELSSACQRSDGSFTVPRVDDPAYVEALATECQKRGITMIIPTIDTELPILATDREELMTVGIHAIVSDFGLVRETGDKRKTPECMAELCIDTPRAIPSDDLEFPAFVKPREGSSSVGIVLAQSAYDLRPEHLDANQFIIQEYMSPNEYDEMTIDLYYDQRGQLKCLIPRLRIALRAGEMSKGQTIRDEVYAFLLERVRVWQGARGCLTLQVFASKDRTDIRAIEVNPRFGGGFPLSYAAGARFPRWLMQEYLLGEEVDFFDEWERDLLMLRYDEGVLVHAPGS
jgi:carbamoyl-phosphate synthase large subunit